MNLKRLKNYLVITLMALAPNVASAVTSASSISTKKQTLFSSASHMATPYRIPAIATLKNGTILTIADHRPSGYDVGANSNNGKVDIYARIGSIDPNGNYTWTANNDIVNYTGSDKIQIANGDSSYGYGDAAVVVDSESGEVLLLCVGATKGHKYGANNSAEGYDCVRFTGSADGKTWTMDNTKLTSKVKSAVNTSITEFFFASGRLLQSTKIKVGTHYRIYGAILAYQSGDKNFVVYSDDFGKKWTRLGSSTSCCQGGNEAKLVELDNGDLILSSRTGGGRYYNVFTYSDKTNWASGSWEYTGKPSSSWFSDPEVKAELSDGSSCNGEFILYKGVTRKSDNAKVDILLQSLPTGSNRSKVSVYYQEINSSSTPTAKTIAKNWTKGIEVDDAESAYSTMTILPNGEIGFLYEDEYFTSNSSDNKKDGCAPGGTSNIVYVPLTVSEITGGAYTYVAENGEPVVPTVATPSITPNGGTIFKEEAITLSCNTKDATIYYTIDDTEPTVSSTKYEGEFTLSASATVRAIAVKEGCNDSQVASATYTVVDNDKTKVRFKNVQKNGTVYYFTYDATNGLGLTTNENDATLYARGNGTTNGTYTFQTPDGNYLIFSGRDLSDSNNRGYNSGKGFLTSYESAKCDLTVATMVAGGKVESFTGSYVTITGQRDFTTKESWFQSTVVQEQAYFVITSDGKFDGATDPYFNDTYSSAFVIEEVVVEEPEPAVAAPVFSLPSGTYEEGTELTISCPTEGARIFLTIDGTTPTEESGEIPNGFTTKLYSSMAISAIAILDGECSEVVTYEYLIGDIETVATPRIYPNGGEIEEGTEIAISCDTQGATIYYSIDGSEPNIEYETAFTLTEAATVRAIAKKQYWNNSEEATASFTIKQNVVETIATPVITPDGGEVEAGAMISITCETVGVTIYYSINGSEPGRVYTGPFALTESTTVRAIAKKTGWNNSEEVTATFTVIEEDNEEDGLRTINITLEKGVLGGISRYATTFSAPYNVEIPSGVDKYIVTNTATSIIILNRSYGDVIPANQGVVLVSKYKSEIEIKEIDEEVSTAAWRKNKLMNTADGAIVAQSGFYVFGKDSKGVMEFTQAEVGSTIEANKAYLQIGGTSIRAFALGLDDDPDVSGIEDVNAEDAEVEYYNLQGVKVENPEKGIYIMKQGGKTSKVVL